MPMLHTVNKSPFERNTLDSCLRLAKPGGAILFIEDGVFAALKGTAQSDKIQKSLERFSFYVLGPDVRARGLKEDQVIEGIKVVDYAGFVDLAAQHDSVQAWL
jgi:tRNA 2-thiouridine synthesizing protein B